DQSKQIAEFVGAVLRDAKQWGIKTKSVKHFYLAPAQREVLLLALGVDPATKAKLAGGASSFSFEEVAGMMMALAVNLQVGDARKREGVLLVAQHLRERLQHGFAVSPRPEAATKADSTPKVASDTLFQFKITLLG